MNFKQRFDDIITYIEDNIKKDKKSIMDGVRKRYSSKINFVFEFMTDTSLNEYITRRKLIKILEYKKDTQCSLEAAVEEFDYSQDSNYMKTFKKIFGTTVKGMTDEMYEYERMPKYTDVLLSRNADEVSEEAKMMMEHKVFDLPIPKVKSLKYIFELSDFYGFEEDDADLAYRLSEYLDDDLDDIFRFVFDYREYKAWMKKVHITEDDMNLAVIYLRANVTIREAVQIMNDLKKNALIEIEDYRKIPVEFWTLYNDSSLRIDIEISELWDKYSQLKKRNYKYNDIVAILNDIAFADDIDDAIELYDFDIDMEQISLQYEREQMDALEVDVLSTYTDDFLGISHDPDDFFYDYNEDDE